MNSSPDGIGARLAATIVCLALFLGLHDGDAANAQPTPRGDREFTEVPMPQTTANAVQRLKTDDRLRDLLRHPAFSGFGHFRLPWDNRAYDLDMRLNDIGSLLPYHSHVSPSVIVESLNHMIGDAGTGHTIFFDIYSEAQRRNDPSKANTGLFFLRGQPGAPFAIIAPGGGFSYVGSVHEGFPFAVEISKRGHNAFVVKYRVGLGGAAATEDLAAAISYVFRNASALGVGAESYSLWGSSAGARMAAAIGTHGVARFGGDALPKPAAVVIAYTGHSDYSSDDPATFVVVGDQDGIAPPSTMKRRVMALRRVGVSVEYQEYENVGHGFGLGKGTSAEGWTEAAIRFWERQMRARR